MTKYSSNDPKDVQELQQELTHLKYNQVPQENFKFIVKEGSKGNSHDQYCQSFMYISHNVGITLANIHDREKKTGVR